MSLCTGNRSKGDVKRQANDIIDLPEAVTVGGQNRMKASHHEHDQQPEEIYENASY